MNNAYAQNINQNTNRVSAFKVVPNSTPPSTNKEKVINFEVKKVDKNEAKKTNNTQLDFNNLYQNPNLQQFNILTQSPNDGGQKIQSAIDYQNSFASTVCF